MFSFFKKKNTIILEEQRDLRQQRMSDSKEVFGLSLKRKTLLFCCVLIPAILELKKSIPHWASLWN